MATQPMSLEWLCYIRDHGKELDVTLGERALASLLPTYGQGKNITVTMKGLADVTGWSRTTVIKHRDGLLAKGLLEDITGNPENQKRVYKLNTPGVQNIDEGVQNLNTPVQILDTTCTEVGHNIKSEIKLEINTTSRADDVSGAAGESLDLDLLAKTLGVDSLRANIISLANSLATSHGSAVVLSVAEKCRVSARSNPAGLFVTSAKDMCAQHIEAQVKAEARESAITWYDEYHDKKAAKKARNAELIAAARAKPRLPRSRAEFRAS